MNSIRNEDSQHPDELLPWFVNGTLSGEELARVEKHLRECKQCDQEIQFFQQVRREVREQEVPSPGELGLNRFLKQIRPEKTVPIPKPRIHIAWWRNPLAVAASLVIVIQFALLVSTWTPNQTYTPLSGPKPEGVILQIKFSATATETQIRQGLRSVNAVIVDGPSALGIYKIRLDIPEQNLDAINRSMETLKQNHEVVTHLTRE